MTASTLTPWIDRFRLAIEAAGARHLTDRDLLDRYLASKDQSAFALLVQRHGRRVLAACRAVLGDEAAAEDAFQATFLVLLDKARSVRWRPSLGAWLGAVAHHVAVRARDRAARRRRHEAQAIERPGTAEAPDLSWREAVAVLHEELDRLPERFRRPLLLCYLEGRSRDEAAAALGCSVGAIKGRLERGRERLRRRLERRGIVLSAGLMGAVAAGEASAVPAELASTVLRSSVEGAPAAAAVLARAATRAMTLNRYKPLGALVLTAGLLVGGVGLYQATADEPPKTPAPPAAAVPAADGDVVFRGRVLDPDGKPSAGARVYLFVKRHVTTMPPFQDPRAKMEEVTVNGQKQQRLTHPRLDELRAKYGFDRPDPAKLDPVRDRPMIDELVEAFAQIFGDDPVLGGRVYARSAADGRFEFRVARRYLREPLARDVELAAWAPGYGPAWFWPGDGETFADVALRLPADVPVQGRLIDLEGRPVAGATVKLKTIRPLDGWLALVDAAARGDTQKYNELLMPVGYVRWQEPMFLPPAVTTDADGRFRIAGVGAERALELEVVAPGNGSDEFTVMTRPGPGRQPATGTGFPRNLRSYGATFTHVLATTRPVVGTVRDHATGKPIAGAQVAAWGPAYADARTDKDGKYRLTGLAKAKEYDLLVGHNGDQPYLNTSLRVGDDAGLGPLTADVALVRGVWLQGRVSDAATGRPVPRARVRYGAAKDNPNLAPFAFDGNPAFRDNRDGRNAPLLEQAHTMTDDDGRFRLAVLPGRGLLGVTADESPYPPAEPPAAKKGDRPGDYVPYLGQWTEFDALRPLDVPRQDQPVTLDVALSAGRTVAGTMTDTDGRPLTGVRVHGLKAREFQPPEPLKSARFTVTGLSPGHPRLLVAELPDRKLAGLLRVEGDAAGPLNLRLGPTGSATGRLIDSRTQAAYARKTVMALFADRKLEQARGTRIPATIGTDGEGRFRLDGLIPGVTYDLFLSEPEKAVLHRAGRVTVAAGEAKDLGDLPVKLTPVP